MARTAGTPCPPLLLPTLLPLVLTVLLLAPVSLARPSSSGPLYGDIQQQQTSFGGFFQASKGGLIGPLFRHDMATDKTNSTGCYYQFKHYEEGERIITKESCLNCTCHNSMLMCYLKVCPFSKPIGKDCKVERQPNKCCPVITCPTGTSTSDTQISQVPVSLQVMEMATTTTTTLRPTATTTSETGLVPHTTRGCYADNKYYPDGAQLPGDPGNPCELCYCIKNRTSCVLKECILTVEGCRPQFLPGICCPVRYNCTYEDGTGLISTSTEPDIKINGTAIEFPSTTLGPLASACFHEGKYYDDGDFIPTEDPCDHCYCMKGDAVCAIQECKAPLDDIEEGCVPRDPPPGQCCAEAYDCPEEEVVTVIPVSSVTDDPFSTSTEDTVDPSVENTTLVATTGDDDLTVTETPTAAPTVPDLTISTEKITSAESSTESEDYEPTSTVLSTESSTDVYPEVPSSTPEGTEAPELKPSVVTTKSPTDTVTSEEPMSTTPLPGEDEGTEDDKEVSVTKPTAGIDETTKVESATEKPDSGFSPEEPMPTEPTTDQGALTTSEDPEDFTDAPVTKPPAAINQTAEAEYTTKEPAVPEEPSTTESMIDEEDETVSEETEDIKDPVTKPSVIIDETAETETTPGSPEEFLPTESTTDKEGVTTETSETTDDTTEDPVTKPTAVIDETTEAESTTKEPVGEVAPQEPSTTESTTDGEDITVSEGTEDIKDLVTTPSTVIDESAKTETTTVSTEELLPTESTTEKEEVATSETTDDTTEDSVTKPTAVIDETTEAESTTKEPVGEVAPQEPSTTESTTDGEDITVSEGTEDIKDLVTTPFTVIDESAKTETTTVSTEELLPTESTTEKEEVATSETTDDTTEDSVTKPTAVIDETTEAESTTKEPVGEVAPQEPSTTESTTDGEDITASEGTEDIKDLVTTPSAVIDETAETDTTTGSPEELLPTESTTDKEEVTTSETADDTTEDSVTKPTEVTDETTEAESTTKEPVGEVAPEEPSTTESTTDGKDTTVSEGTEDIKDLVTTPSAVINETAETVTTTVSPEELLPTESTTDKEEVITSETTDDTIEDSVTKPTAVIDETTEAESTTKEPVGEVAPEEPSTTESTTDGEDMTVSEGTEDIKDLVITPSSVIDETAETETTPGSPEELLPTESTTGKEEVTTSETTDDTTEDLVTKPTAVIDETTEAESTTKEPVGEVAPQEPSTTESTIDGEDMTVSEGTEDIKDLVTTPSAVIDETAATETTTGSPEELLPTEPTTDKEEVTTSETTDDTTEDPVTKPTAVIDETTEAESTTKEPVGEVAPQEPSTTESTTDGEDITVSEGTEDIKDLVTTPSTVIDESAKTETTTVSTEELLPTESTTEKEEVATSETTDDTTEDSVTKPTAVIDETTEAESTTKEPVGEVAPQEPSTTESTTDGEDIAVSEGTEDIKDLVTTPSAVIDESAATDTTTVSPEELLPTESTTGKEEVTSSETTDDTTEDSVTKPTAAIDETTEAESTTKEPVGEVAPEKPSTTESTTDGEDITVSEGTEDIKDLVITPSVIIDETAETETTTVSPEELLPTESTTGKEEVTTSETTDYTTEDFVTKPPTVTDETVEALSTKEPDTDASFTGVPTSTVPSTEKDEEAATTTAGTETFEITDETITTETSIGFVTSTEPLTTEVSTEEDKETVPEGTEDYQTVTDMTTAAEFTASPTPDDFEVTSTLLPTTTSAQVSTPKTETSPPSTAPEKYPTEPSDKVTLDETTTQPSLPEVSEHTVVTEVSHVTSEDGIIDLSTSDTPTDQVTEVSDSLSTEAPEEVSTLPDSLYETKSTSQDTTDVLTTTPMSVVSSPDIATTIDMKDNETMTTVTSPSSHVPDLKPDSMVTDAGTKPTEVTEIESATKDPGDDLGVEPIESVIPTKPESTIPGEGNCISEGVTYTNGSTVPTSSLCQESCFCDNSVVRCYIKSCKPKPPNFLQCTSIVSSDQCCPLFKCPEVDSEVLPSPNCIVQGIQYLEGKQIPSSDPCTVCYCMDGEYQCSVQQCPVPEGSCVPVEEAIDDCCPSKYYCAEVEVTTSVPPKEIGENTTLAPPDGEMEIYQTTTSPTDVDSPSSESSTTDTGDEISDSFTTETSVPGTDDASTKQPLIDIEVESDTPKGDIGIEGEPTEDPVDSTLPTEISTSFPDESTEPEGTDTTVESSQTPVYEISSTTDSFVGTDIDDESTISTTVEGDTSMLPDGEDTSAVHGTPDYPEVITVFPAAGINATGTSAVIPTQDNTTETAEPTYTTEVHETASPGPTEPTYTTGMYEITFPGPTGPTVVASTAVTPHETEDTVSPSEPSGITETETTEAYTTQAPEETTLPGTDITPGIELGTSTKSPIDSTQPSETSTSLPEESTVPEDTYFTEEPSQTPSYEISSTTDTSMEVGGVDTSEVYETSDRPGTSTEIPVTGVDVTEVSVVTEDGGTSPTPSTQDITITTEPTYTTGKYEITFPGPTEPSKPTYTTETPYETESTVSPPESSVVTETEATGDYTTPSLEETTTQETEIANETSTEVPEDKEPQSTVGTGVPEQGCLENGILYKNNDYVPSYDVCYECQCLENEIVCSKQICVSPGDDCIPLVTPPGFCCPTKYKCPDEIPDYLTTEAVLPATGVQNTTSTITGIDEEDVAATTSGVPGEEAVTEVSVTAEKDTSKPPATSVGTEAEEEETTTITPVGVDEKPMVIHPEVEETESPPETVTHDSSCRVNETVYASGDLVPPTSSCQIQCSCNNGTVMCEYFSCPSPASFLRCTSTTIDGECCSQYDCESPTEGSNKKCEHYGFRYDESDYIPSPDICTDCYCIHGKVVCAKIDCPPPKENCFPKPRTATSCCPQYSCIETPVPATNVSSTMPPSTNATMITEASVSTQSAITDKPQVTTDEYVTVSTDIDETPTPESYPEGYTTLLPEKSTEFYTTLRPQVSTDEHPTPDQTESTESTLTTASLEDDTERPDIVEGITTPLPDETETEDFLITTAQPEEVSTTTEFYIDGVGSTVSTEKPPKVIPATVTVKPSVNVTTETPLEEDGEPHTDDTPSSEVFTDGYPTSNLTESPEAIITTPSSEIDTDGQDVVGEVTIDVPDEPKTEESHTTTVQPEEVSTTVTEGISIDEQEPSVNITAGKPEEEEEEPSIDETPVSEVFTDESTTLSPEEATGFYTTQAPQISTDGYPTPNQTESTEGIITTETDIDSPDVGEVPIVPDKPETETLSTTTVQPEEVPTTTTEEISTDEQESTVGAEKPPIVIPATATVKPSVNVTADKPEKEEESFTDEAPSSETSTDGFTTPLPEKTTEFYTTHAPQVSTGGYPTPNQTELIDGILSMVTVAPATGVQNTTSTITATDVDKKNTTVSDGPEKEEFYTTTAMPEKVSPITQSTPTTTWTPSTTTELVLGPPGSCLFNGEIYVSAQQIPRDDPCDFCFCFRSDIICLQQTCPPPITGCYEEPIPGFCCPRYECPVHSYKFNVTTTTTPIPTFPPILKEESVTMCEVANKWYYVGEIVYEASGPCLECKCGRSGMMECDPKQCQAQPMLRKILFPSNNSR